METGFFWLSKIVWSVISPETLLVLSVLASWILLTRGKPKWASRLLALTSACLMVLSVFPVGEWILYPLDSRFPANPVLPERIDGIIVLGGAEDAQRTSTWEQVELNDSAERFTASLALARRYPKARILFTSGSGSPLAQEFKGATVARLFYEQQGVDTSRLVYESDSRNTAENVSMSKSLLNPRQGENWILVTSAFHMPRAVGIFCRAAWQVIPYPVDHRTLRGNLLRVGAGVTGNIYSLSIGIKEWVGLFAYFLTDRTDTLLPSGCHG